MVRVEFFASRRRDGGHLVAAQGALQLLEGGFCALANLLHAGFLNGQPGFQAVYHGQQAFGKPFDRKFSDLAHFVFGAAAHVFDFGLGAQILLGQLGVLGLCHGQFGGQVGPRLLRVLGLSIVSR